MKRYVSISLPQWSADRWRRRHPDRARRDQGQPDQGQGESGPLVFTAPAQGGLRLTAVDAHAAAEGLYPGQRLADARALMPALQAVASAPLEDAQALGQLADWCGRYTPWSAVDGDDGLTLDITGCAHLFGGEAALIADLVGRLARFGVTARAAVADTPAAAWAWARFGDGSVLATGESRAKLDALPVEALRLAPATADSLRRLGLRRIGDLAALPRGPLTVRLGGDVLKRLDRAFGVEAEAISPRRAPALWRARLTFADGIVRREDLDAGTRQLLEELCRALEADGRGARQLELALYRLDGTAQFLEIGTSKPAREAVHLLRLFAEELGTVDPGFGIETMILGAVATDRLAPRQMALAPARRCESEDLAPIIDRLQSRLGRDAIVRLVPVESHLPERAVTVAPALDPARQQTWPAELPRPVQLLAAPEPIEVNGEMPDSFRWRGHPHRIARVEGPERLAPEWWRAKSNPATRDYYWLQDSEGRRYWVYRTLNTPPAWYLHGLFA